MSTDTIGKVVAFDESFSDDIPTLLEGGQIGIRESRGSFGWLLTRYEPVLDSAGQCVAYVGADISMIGVTEYNRNFAKWIAVISSAFLVTLAVIGVYFYIHTRRADEYDESDDHVENRVQVEQRASFGGWNAWKDKNRKGLDCAVTIKREDNVITMLTENLGIAVHSVTTIRDDVKDVYVALTGDQCAITNIRVNR